MPKRDGKNQRRKSEEWKEASNSVDRDKLFTLHGTRWTELACLPYFDIVRQSIVDPMHNLLLGAPLSFFLSFFLSLKFFWDTGVAKTQWYTAWIKSNALRASTTARARELDIVHHFLETVRLKFNGIFNTLNLFIY